MAYKVLYRKYRPDCFEKVIGQKIITDTLKNSVINNNISHAYMFTGPRGTGKTSTAKILAKAINCENNNSGEPCGVCQSCLNFNTSPDIIEIDAASNNGVDEIRELRNNVTLAPSSSKYKIYIIDEVHMLSPGAFNALLKTLEEPPSHAIFILATTEIYKVPITILSRCQRFDFKKIEHKDMVDALKEICKKEDITCETTALDEIYLLSDGCMRDALSLLDQITKSSRKITQEDIIKNYNTISNKTIENLLDNTYKGNINDVLEILTDFQNSGLNPQKLLKKIINYLELLLIDIKMKKNNKYDFSKLSLLVKDLNECYINARINENVFTMIKIAFLEQLPSSTVDIQETIEPKNNAVQNQLIKQKPISLIDIRINNCFVDANKKSLTNIQDMWEKIDSDRIQSIDLSIYKPVVASDTYAVFTVEDPSLADLFNIKAETIEKMLSKSDINIKVVAISEKHWNIEKEKYMKNLKNKIKYEYIEETINNKYAKESELNDLFESSPIEIN